MRAVVRVVVVLIKHEELTYPARVSRVNAENPMDEIGISAFLARHSTRVKVPLT
jgi:hypothetical protein